MYRLKQLKDNNYIKIIGKQNNNENIYSFTKKTASIFSAQYSQAIKTDKLNHYLACADFYFYIKNKSPEFIQLEYQYYFYHNNKKYSFRPDILIQIDRWYFVEIDLNNKRFNKKIKNWDMFYISRAFKDYFEKYPPIIIVSTNPNKIQREINLYKTIDLNYIFKDYDEIKNWKYKY